MRGKHASAELKAAVLEWKRQRDAVPSLKVMCYRLGVPMRTFQGIIERDRNRQRERASMDLARK